ncbi:MAG TPA: inorganic diphosphatase [Phototrophicaceae bacterium]|nr:inorganic diphosphatase [Phototrophicaceae bacterium]
MPTVRDPFARLPAIDAETGYLNVIIETPKGSRNKYKHEPKYHLFSLSKVLPAGSTFPYDFGYVPSTVGADGDPLDVLVLMDEIVFPGCLITARLVGVIKATQTDNDEEVRNDRLIAIASQSRDQQNVHSIEQLDAYLLDEIEHFFVSYHELDGETFHPRARLGPEKALKIVDKAIVGKRRTRRQKIKQ